MQHETFRENVTLTATQHKDIKGNIKFVAKMPALAFENLRWNNSRVISVWVSSCVWYKNRLFYSDVKVTHQNFSGCCFLFGLSLLLHSCCWTFFAIHTEKFRHVDRPIYLINCALWFKQRFHQKWTFRMLSFLSKWDENVPFFFFFF